MIVTENGNTQQQLIMCLKHDYDIDWAERAEFYKTYDSKTLHIRDKSNTKNSAEINIDADMKKATLEICDGQRHTLNVKEDGSKIYKKVEIDLSVASMNILSVIPVISSVPRRRVDLTDEGVEWGLKTAWSSLRPIVIDVMTGEFVSSLANTKSLVSKSLIKYDRQGFRPWCKRHLERIRSIEIGKNGIGIEVLEKQKEDIPRLRYFEKYASAWFKQFKQEDINSGFVRIWDFSPKVITKAMTDELYDVARHKITKAGARVRLGSFGIDLAIFFIIGVITGFVLFNFWSAIEVVVPITFLLCFFISLGYFTYFFGKGQTVGMKVEKIKLYNKRSGTCQIGYAKGFYRWIGMIISGFVIFLGFFWIVIGENKQGWHDKMAGTYVVLKMLSNNSKTEEK